MIINTNQVSISPPQGASAQIPEMKASQLIELVDIQAILYLCVQGGVELTESEHQLDIQI